MKIYFANTLQAFYFQIKLGTAMAKPKKPAKEKDLKPLKDEKAGKEKKVKKEKPVEAKVEKKAAPKKTKVVEEKVEAVKATTKAIKAKAVAPVVEAAEVVFTFTTEELSLRAYFIAERRQAMGWPGDETSDWVEAERQLLAEAKKKAKS